MTTRRNPHAAHAGMTLVELMIVLVILAILAAVAWPSYQNAVQRSRRADAVAALTEIMQAQERWRANNPAYKATLTEPALPGTRTVSSDGHYNLTLSVPDAPANASTYTAVATVRNGSPQTADSRCQVMRVVVAGGNIAYTSGASADATNAGTPDPCWQK